MELNHKTVAIILALVFLVLSLISCTPHSTEEVDQASSSQAESASEPESISPVCCTSEFGCSVIYDPSLFEVLESEDEKIKQEELALASIEPIKGFSVCFRVSILDTSTVEEGVDYLSGTKNLDCIHRIDFPDEVIREEVTFGTERYAATRLTYNEVYAVGDLYVTQKNDTVYMVDISSYYQPPDELLAGAYDILDSVTLN